jgi:hypothetical protein
MRMRLATPVLVSLVASALGACDQGSPRPASVSAPPKPTLSAAASARAVPPEPRAAEPVDAAPPPPAKHQPPKSLPPGEKDDRPTAKSRYVLDGLNDVGPAAPATAFAAGVVMVTRSDELELVRLLQPPSKSKKPAPGTFAPTARGPGDFWPVARGPGVSKTHAYWVSKGRVLQRPLDGGDTRVLATDARDGTRVAVAGSPDIVAYVTRAEGKQDSVARLLLPDGRRLELTPEGSAASSVSLTNMGEDVMVSYIDGRSGMTPMHARRLHTKTGTLDPDVVVWVSGATQGLTELSSVGSAEGAWLLLPVERDASHFGLATLAVAANPKMDPPLRWRTYENGLDRAPARGLPLCGATVGVYVRPATATPGSDQELVLSELTLDEVAESEVLATARGFADVSLYPLPEGAVLSYVADRRTWARLIRCK